MHSQRGTHPVPEKQHTTNVDTTSHHHETQHPMGTEIIVSGPIKKPEAYGIRSTLHRKQAAGPRVYVDRQRIIQQAHAEWLDRQNQKRTYSLNGFDGLKAQRYNTQQRIHNGMSSHHRAYTPRPFQRPLASNTAYFKPKRTLPVREKWAGLEAYNVRPQPESEEKGKSCESKEITYERNGSGSLEGPEMQTVTYNPEFLSKGFLGKRAAEQHDLANLWDSNTYGVVGNDLYSQDESESCDEIDSGDEMENNSDKKWPPVAKEWLKKWKYNDPEVCCICYVETCDSINPFVYCDEPDCDVIVHQECYGINCCPGPDETWRCDRCAALKLNPSKLIICALCPSSRGAFRKLEGPFFGMGWVHITCALWIPGVSISDKRTITGINLRSIKQSYWKGKCIVCKDMLHAEYGAFVSCEETGCSQTFHVTCGLKYTLARKTITGKNNIRCYEHDTREKFRRVRPEQRMNLWDRWAESRDDYLLTADGTLNAKKEFSSAWFKAYKNGYSEDDPESYANIYDSFCGELETICTRRCEIPARQIVQQTEMITQLYKQIQDDPAHGLSISEKEVNNILTSIQHAVDVSRRSKRYYEDIIEQATRLSFKLSFKPVSEKKNIPAVTLTRKPSNNLKSRQRSHSTVEPSVDISNKPKTSLNTLKKQQVDNQPKVPVVVGPPAVPNTLPNIWSIPSTSTLGSQKQTFKGSKHKPGTKYFGADESPIVPKSTKPATKPKAKPHPPKKAKTVEPEIQRKSSKSVEKAPKLVERKAKTEEELRNCVCGECNQNKLPLDVLERLKVTEDYMKRLDETVHLRQNGYTGKGLYWDPRVFIECSICKNEFHCGCPDPPIKNYPAPHELFVCVQCDTTAEDLEEIERQKEVKDSVNRTRVKARINYKE